MKKTGTILDYQGPATIAVAEGESEAFNENWTAAEHEHGVAYICPWEDPYAGFPEHSRRCARALDDAGMHVHMRSIDPSIQWHMHFEVGGADKVALREQYDDLLTKSIKNYLVEIYQVVPDDAILQRLTTHRWLDPDQLAVVNSFRIISCVFERDRVSEHAVRALNRVAQVWVANDKDRLMLHEHGVERVEVVPIPYFPSDPMVALRGVPRQPGPVRFYHIGKWEHRKAHHEMLGAFMMAFKPGEAKLYFKTSTKAPDFGDYPSSPEESVHRWMENDQVRRNGWTVEIANKNIHLIKRRIPPSQITQLHKLGDVYLSLSRGEGFDMPAYDAKLAGNLMVWTPSGGPQMFASARDYHVPFSGKVRCHPFYKWGDARYGDWEYGDAVLAMRMARQGVLNGWNKLADEDALALLSAEAVGQKMRSLIQEVVDDGKQRSDAAVAASEAEA
jgi:hypothetical protein